jgi:thiamine phosphate synthase YjbQ (UPF0047 family)
LRPSEGEGLALINAMHITASVFIDDDERGLHADYDEWLERLAPHEWFLATGTTESARTMLTPR